MKYRQILVAIDGGEASELALDVAIDLAKNSRAVLQLLHVLDNNAELKVVPGYDPIPIRDLFATRAEHIVNHAVKLADANGVKTEPCIIEMSALDSDIAHEIKLAAEKFNADLVVLGTNNRKGISRLLHGSVTERCLRLLCRPVLVIPGSMHTLEAHYFEKGKIRESNLSRLNN